MAPMVIRPDDALVKVECRVLWSVGKPWFPWVSTRKPLTIGCFSTINFPNSTSKSSGISSRLNSVWMNFHLLSGCLLSFDRENLHHKGSYLMLNYYLYQDKRNMITSIEHFLCTTETLWIAQKILHHFDDNSQNYLTSIPRLSWLPEY